MKFVSEQPACLHLERRAIERVSRGILTDKRPNLVLWVCHFPLPSLSGIQCQVAISGSPCPHNGPYGKN
jgi:hypothetical protein